MTEPFGHVTAPFPLGRTRHPPRAIIGAQKGRLA